jgi:hypothetical protein
LLKAGLLRAGISETAISTVPNAAEAIRYSLHLASEGDLLVLLPGDVEITSTWELITSYDAGSARH